MSEHGMIGRWRCWPGLVAFVALVGQAVAATAQPPVFRAGVDLVTIRAVVRDGRGRPVTTLGHADFELIDRGESRPILTVEREFGAVGLALLFDVSGSMDLPERLTRARETGYFLLSGLRSGQDEAAIFAFDSSLRVVQPFTSDLGTLRGTLTGMDPFGATSLHDAVAMAAQQVETRGTARRALVVLTDGFDNYSKRTAAEVSGIAAAIDLPVYVIAVVSSVDDPRGGRSEHAALSGSLADLSRWTGGRLFVATSTAEAQKVAAQVVEELRHQYLIAFEPSPVPGWHPVEIRTKRRGHVVQARGGYMAGGSGQ